MHTAPSPDQVADPSLRATSFFCSGRRFRGPAAILIALLCLAGGTGGCLSGADAAPSTQPLVDLPGAPRDALFAFLGWAGNATLATDGIRITSMDGKGGLTLRLQTDAAATADWIPRLTVIPGPGHRARMLTLKAASVAKGVEHVFRFRLDGLAAGRASEVLADDRATLAKPSETTASEGGGAFDPAHLIQAALIGDWQGDAYDLTITRIDLVAADATTRLPSAATPPGAKPVTAARHPADGPQVVNIGAVAPDILGIEIQAGEYRPGAMRPYAAQPGDERSGGSDEWVVRDGKLIQARVGQVVKRSGGGASPAVLGTLCSDGSAVLSDDAISGAPLELRSVDEPAAYAISSTDDPAYAAPTAPLAVHRKSKPDSPPCGDAMAIRHQLFLKLPKALREGATYAIRFTGINTRAETANYRHDTRTARSAAIHVVQTGFRPDDAFKRGYLSLWMGSGGGLAYAGIDGFELVDARSGKTVYTGKAVPGQVNQAQHAMQRSDYAQAPTWWLDFSDFRTPGEYRVRVPGIGCSHPFTIAGTVWQEAFRTAMRGVLSQRSGIALGKPFLDFNRPRPCHPDDGVRFYQIDIGIAQGQEGARGEALLRLWKANGKLDEVHGLWGGYQDAGDWDVYTTTLSTADELLEAFEIGGDFARKVILSLPPAEAGNAIPDLLDEALWGLAAFKRLQRPDGAVRDGFGDGWGARNGDVSWNDSNPVCVYMPSTATSWRYAAVAARMARALAPFDQAQATAYRESAVRAWTWAEAQPRAAGEADDAKPRDQRWLAMHHEEAVAAVALYACTREAAYHERFKRVCELQDDVPTEYDGRGIEPMQQPDATFEYARLPQELADPALRKRAADRYVLAGNVAAWVMQHNAYNIATAFPGVPMRGFCSYFTNPGMGRCVVRAHVVSHDARHLEAAIASTGFGLGANPENVVFTTGLGAEPIRFPLKLDSRRSGQPAPAGITVYGPSDQHEGSYSEWVHTWFLTPARMFPASKTWPAPETYADISIWPDANEYCVNAPLTTAAYVWCYLAARP